MTEQASIPAPRSIPAKSSPTNWKNSASPTDFARQINVPANRVSQIINGKRAITGDTALRLGHWFRTSAAFWLNLQSAYDLRMAEQVAGAEVNTLPVRPTEVPRP